MTGRPSKFTAKIADEICERLAEGESLIDIVRSYGMPSYSTVLKWRADNEAFSEMYTRAREDSAHYDADEMKVIADNPDIPPDQKRIMIDVRKWAAGKRNAKHYGEKVHQEITGADGGPIILWGAQRE